VVIDTGLTHVCIRVPATPPHNVCLCCPPHPHRLTSLAGLSACPSLTHLDVSHNNLQDAVSGMHVIGACTAFVHARYWCMHSIGACAVLVHAQYWCMHSIGARTALVHASYWCMHMELVQLPEHLVKFWCFLRWFSVIPCGVARVLLFMCVPALAVPMLLFVRYLAVAKGKADRAKHAAQCQGEWFVI